MECFSKSLRYTNYKSSPIGFILVEIPQDQDYHKVQRWDKECLLCSTLAVLLGSEQPQQTYWLSTVIGGFKEEIVRSIPVGVSGLPFENADLPKGVIDRGEGNFCFDGVTMHCNLRNYCAPLSLHEETQFQYSNPKRFKKSRIWRGSSLGLSSKLV